MIREGPDVSVVLPTDSYDTVRAMLSHLRAQAASDRLEIVLVAPAGAGFERTPRDGFFDLRVVEVDRVEWLPRARARGIQAARAPVVVLAETHAYPQPGWAEALLAAHRGPWTVVSPTFVNANPGSMISWANLFMDYGPCVEVREPGPRDGVPGHNSSYRRAALLEYGDALEDMLRSDTLLLQDLRRQGHRFYIEPAARIAHLNVSRPSSWLVERFLAGRAFAALRARPWSRARRLAYAAASPLIPLVRARRLLRDVRRAGLAQRLLPRLLPALVVGLVVSAAGELCGYTLGTGAPDRLYEMELHKVRHLRRGEREPG